MIFSDRAGDTFKVRYDDISKVIFEVTTHMHGPTLSTVVLTGVGGGALGGIANAMHVHDSWLYLEYKNVDQNETGSPGRAEGIVRTGNAKAKSLFGSRVSMPEFQEKGEAIQKGEDLDEKHVPDLRSKHTVKVDKNNSSTARGRGPIRQP